MSAEYPESRRDESVVDTLHGHQIADPYRWLEDADSAETKDWVSRQNAATEAELSRYPERAWFQETMTAILARPRAGVPGQESGWFFVGRNDGSHAQDIVYVADSLEGLLEGGRVILDPNNLSEEGTDSLASFAVSPDGRYFAYGVNESGSDWTTFRLREVATGADVDDVVTRAKFSEATWLPDSSAYLYLHYPASGRSEGTETQALRGGQLKLHKVGTPQENDELVLSFPDNNQVFIGAEVSDDDRYLVVTLTEGTDPATKLWLYPFTDGGLGEPVKVIDEFHDETVFVRMSGDQLVLRTDRDAPRGRVVASDLAGNFTDLIPEGDSVLHSVRGTAAGLAVFSLLDAQPVLSLHDLDGGNARIVPVPGGAVVGLNASTKHDEVFIGLSTTTDPTVSYVVSASSGEFRALPELVPAGVGFLSPDITITRRVEPGREVPYFLISRADLTFDKPRPTLLYGYGGFRIPIFADYRPGWPAWLAAGGVLVIANLRGGGEYGSDWHEAGRLRNKQNVFDDFIAVGEHLTKTKVTSAAQLAIHGRSNGGLLVGAVMAQRPDLFAVALPGVGVMDMLRFHLFTVGAAWASDFGLPDDPEQFEDLLAYSPLHNLREGTAYPATLVVTGDHDDRVVPLHSHKFMAALQHVQSGGSPVLSRIEVNTGHGFGKPAAMVASEWADLLAFAAHHTGLQPGA
ncbi:prolyl oligopeptidase family serine peptidase [Kribbella sp. CA-293567]|uniref:prolyl oligopeptidase family serine peptidase n=1 Tax=Kribbella sp. CA-293567 TaxID=3002436 RepID=UPI0022DD7E5D|nr:prolyl oligopeptidase family serine peptidase [Kribbella sp. CA-293567]WBQ02488.1 prolyl oligopeptidase family serine peptidase [Kribbella sp. CA-293567]